MSGIRYKRTENDYDDESSLPKHMEGDNEVGKDMMEMLEVRENGDELINNGPDHERVHENVDYQYTMKKQRVKTCYLVWAIVATIIFVAFLTVDILNSIPNKNVRWCCIGENEVEKCERMANAFEMDSFTPGFECIKASTSDECVNKIDADEADVFTISNNQLYKYRDRLYPIMAEDYESTDFGFYLVAVVKKDDDSTRITTEGLTGKVACIKDFDLTVGYLHNQSIVMPDSSCNVKEAISNLFAKTCAPMSAMCTNCPGKKCTSLKNESLDIIETCLFGSDTDITFIDHLSLLKFMKNKKDFEENYRLLCPNGEHGFLKDVKSCGLLLQPSHAVVVSNDVRSSFDKDIPAEVVEVLVLAQLYFGFHATSKFNMFLDGAGDDLLFHEGTQKLVPLRFNCTAEAYLHTDYLKYRLSYECQVLSKDLGSCRLPQFS